MPYACSPCVDIDFERWRRCQAVFPETSIVQSRGCRQDRALAGSEPETRSEEGCSARGSSPPSEAPVREPPIVSLQEAGMEPGRLISFSLGRADRAIEALWTV